MTVGTGDTYTYLHADRQDTKLMRQTAALIPYRDGAEIFNVLRVYIIVHI